MCLLWWSWLFRQGTAPSEVLFCSCSWLMKPPAVLAADLEFFPGSAQRPSNNRGASIKQGCGQGTAFFCFILQVLTTILVKVKDISIWRGIQTSWIANHVLCLSNFTFLVSPKTCSKTSLRHRILHLTFQAATPQETLADWLLVLSITKMWQNNRVNRDNRQLFF